VKPNHTIKKTMAASEKARNIQAPMPCIRKKSGIPINVKVLKSVAAKLINPRTVPMFEPARIKSSELLFFLREVRDKEIKMVM
jgi:hypothetical protein